MRVSKWHTPVTSLIAGHGNQFHKYEHAPMAVHSCVQSPCPEQGPMGSTPVALLDSSGSGHCGSAWHEARSAYCSGPSDSVWERYARLTYQQELSGSQRLSIETMDPVWGPRNGVCTCWGGSGALALVTAGD